jgi:predicted GNAT family acetyltransferase
MDDQNGIKMNTSKQRFEVQIGEEFGYIDYRFYKGNLAFMHTFIPESDRGKGTAAALAKFGLEYARKENLKIMLYCPFVASYIKRYPEYNDLINREFHPGN